ncbi:hypothetical protein AB0C52_04630 [Streptomyces sp. NPDC048717]
MRFGLRLRLPVRRVVQLRRQLRLTAGVGAADRGCGCDCGPCGSRRL